MAKLKVASPQAAPSSALAKPRPQQAELWRKQDWQRLWLASQVRPWRSLALVPAAPGLLPEEMLRIAVALSHTGMAHLGVPVHVADATRLSLEQLVQFSEEMERHKPSGVILLALPALSENVTAVTLAQSADSALLCVMLRKMPISEAKKTVNRIGASHFIGSAVFRSVPA